MTYYLLILFIIATQTGNVTVQTMEFTSLQACYDTLEWAQAVTPQVGGVRIVGSCRIASAPTVPQQGKLQ